MGLSYDKSDKWHKIKYYSKDLKSSIQKVVAPLKFSPLPVNPDIVTLGMTLSIPPSQDSRCVKLQNETILIIDKNYQEGQTRGVRHRLRDEKPSTAAAADGLRIPLSPVVSSLANSNYIGRLRRTKTSLHNDKAYMGYRVKPKISIY